tara:strand:- start:201 stop:347 length:147 start_codon:yes stop_codon:yes gene_type:complete
LVFVVVLDGTAYVILIHVGVGPLVGTVAGAVVGAGLDLIIAYLDDEVK